MGATPGCAGVAMETAGAGGWRHAARRPRGTPGVVVQSVPVMGFPRPGWAGEGSGRSIPVFPVQGSLLPVAFLNKSNVPLCKGGGTQVTLLLIILSVEYSQESVASLPGI